MSPTPVPTRTRPTRSRSAARRPSSPPATAGRAAAAAALAVVPARRPDADGGRRPRLRVVDDSRLKLAARQRRMRLLMIVAGVVACASVFALAGFHAMLLSGQTRLDELERAVAEEQTRYEELRLNVAMLESPDRIVRVATEDLGMVPPDDVEWLAPTAEPGAGTDGPPARGPEGGGAGGRTWAAIKPHLGGTP